ncbi:MAG: hypothetical protein JWN24_4183 [Phycisphaerales bacterium]|nr:hypothetical protein [Phycisphaerales bacterium]
MPVPDITHLQFLVLEILGPQERSGRFVRDKLAANGEAKTQAAFYQIMARLEDARMVEGSYRPVKVGGHVVQERWYKITGVGRKSYGDTLDFYQRREAAAVYVKGGTHHGR